MSSPSSLIVLAVALGAVICLLVGDYYYRAIEAKVAAPDPLGLDEKSAENQDEQYLQELERDHANDGGRAA